MADIKSVHWRKLEKPSRIDYEKETFSDTYGKFIGEPFEKGYGVTIGNSLRRVLLSSLVGAAITSVKIEGAKHEFSTLPGVVEDVAYIILNLKELNIKMLSDTPETIHIEEKGPKEVKAGDIKTSSNVKILNPDHPIATLAEGGSLKMEMRVELGRGYVPVEAKERESAPIGLIPIDAVFTPVKRVNYYVEKARVGQMMDYDRLIIEVWTDGSLKPDDALAFGAKILKDYLNIFITFEEEEEALIEEISEEDLQRMENLNKRVDQLELSVRSANCLKSAKIVTIADLVKKTEGEMLKYRNFGRRSLDELKKILSRMGLSFGMEIPPLKKNLYKGKIKTRG